MSLKAVGLDRAYRFASKVPAFDITSSDPTDTATGVAVNKTVRLPGECINNIILNDMTYKGLTFKNDSILSFLCPLAHMSIVPE